MTCETCGSTTRVIEPGLYFCDACNQTIMDITVLKSAHRVEDNMYYLTYHDGSRRLTVVAPDTPSG